MIQVTRIIDQSVIDKVDTQLLQEQLPQIEKDVCLIFCATQYERKEDTWEKDGKRYFQIVLDYIQVQHSTKAKVIELMEKLTLERLRLIS